MISTHYTNGYCSNQKNSTETKNTISQAFRITQLVCEILLLVSGALHLFFGSGLVPATMLWTSAAILELGGFIYEHGLETVIACCRNLVSCRSAAAEEAKHCENSCRFKAGLEAVKLTNVIESEEEKKSVPPLLFETLLDKKVVHFEEGEKALVLHAGTFVPPEAKKEPVQFNNLFPTKEGEAPMDCSKITDWLYISYGPQDMDKSMQSFLNLLTKCDRPPLVVMAGNWVEPRTSNSHVVIEKVWQRYWPSGENKSVPYRLGEFEMTLQEHPEELAGVFPFFRKYDLKQEGSEPRLITQYYMRANPNEYIFDDTEKLYAYTSSALKEIQEGKAVVVHDDFGKGQAAVFAICLLLSSLHAAGKESGLTPSVDLNEMIALLRENPEFGREGIIEDQAQYDTIIKFAELLADK